MAVQLKAGDEVEYVPHPEHGKQKYPNGQYAWAFGWLIERQQGREMIRVIEELSPKRLKEQLHYLAKHNDPSAERHKLIPLRPLLTWKAKVRSVNGDGTANLDIQSGANSGVTFHYDRVPVVELSKVHELKARQRDSAGSHPAAALGHTCHRGS